MKKLEKIKKNKIVSYISSALIGIAIAMTLRYTVFTIAHVPSSSMVPTLNVGDALICTTTFFNPPLERGDIIVFKPNDEFHDKHFVKRLIGLPGDHVEINDGVVSINGKVTSEPYIKDRTDYTGSFVVPKGKYFVLGDNRGDSLDARFWKNPFIDESQVQYVAKFKIYPFNDMQKLT